MSAAFAAMEMEEEMAGIVIDALFLEGLAQFVVGIQDGNCCRNSNRRSIHLNLQVFVIKVFIFLKLI